MSCSDTDVYLPNRTIAHQLALEFVKGKYLTKEDFLTYYLEAYDYFYVQLEEHHDPQL